MNLWEKTPGLCEEVPQITPYLPAKRQSDAAVVIFPGGGYAGRAGHEGEGYARFLNEAGIAAFVVDYRVAPHRFPLPLLDARRAVRFVRAKAVEYGVDPNKIAVMGSSAGGHLAALTATYTGTLPEEAADTIDKQDSRPNAQILCYPVICAPNGDGVAHMGSYQNLIGGGNTALEQKADPIQNVTAATPPTFIWHTSDDDCVNVINSYRYATALRGQGIPVEMHILPHGPHGMGLAPGNAYIARWAEWLLRWLSYIGW